MKLKDLIKLHVQNVLNNSRSKREAARKLGISERGLRNYERAFGNRAHQKTVYDCMRNLTPEERDYYESLDGHASQGVSKSRI